MDVEFWFMCGYPGPETSASLSAVSNVDVFPSQPPYGHDENRDLAKQLGIEMVYEYVDMGKMSRVTAAFQSREIVYFKDVEEFVVADNEAKLQQVSATSSKPRCSPLLPSIIRIATLGPISLTAFSQTPRACHS